MTRRADALLDLQHRDFALHQGEDLLQALLHRGHFEKLLLLGNLDGQMGGDGVGELGVVGDLADRGQDFLRHLLVELHIAVELGHRGAGQRLHLGRGSDGVGQHFDLGLEEIGAGGEAHGPWRARRPRPAP